MSAEWRASTGTVLRTGGGITTILFPLGSENVTTGVFPFIVSPFLTALPSAPVPFADAVMALQLPPAYTTSGKLAFPTARTTDVAPNTELDVQRFQADLSALTPGHEAQPLSVFGMAPDIHNGYVPPHGSGGLLRSGREQRLVFLHSHWCCWRYWTQRWTLRDLGPEHLSRPALL
ncbi:MAG: hypothetical protein ACLQVL_03120 [Terriglobia bacterium]